jgi:hypothetical protein
VHLARHVDVGGVLVLGQEGDVQDDREGGRIGAEDGDFADTTVEGLGN